MTAQPNPAMSRPELALNQPEPRHLEPLDPAAQADAEDQETALNSMDRKYAANTAHAPRPDIMPDDPNFAADPNLDAGALYSQRNSQHKDPATPVQDYR